MNIKNYTEVNWLNIIIIKEFQTYLGLKQLKNASRVSKLFRKKLKPLLFKSIILTPYYFDTKFNIKNNIFDEYFNYKFYGAVGYSLSSEVVNFTIDGGLKGLDLALNGIKQYVNRFCIADVKKAGYYLLPLLNIFSNLTELNLESCIIPYNGFFNLGKSSPYLKRIGLIRTMLIKLSTENMSLDDIVLPPNLLYLKIFNCIIANTDVMRNPYEFLFNYSTRLSSRGLALPKIRSYSLKKLTFFGDNLQDSGLKEFLDINSNLESLKIRSLYPNLANSFNSIKRLEIDTVANFVNDTHISLFDSITMLKVGRTYMEYGDDNIDLRLFCLKFPNLKDLDLTLYNYDELITLTDKFLYKITSNLPKLKTLTLKIGKDFFSSLNLFSDDEDDNGENSLDKEEILNINCFSNIEKLYLTANSNILFNINFEKCQSLEQILFCATSERVNTEEFLQKFKSYNNWHFKFTLRTINGIKVSK
jgi:hypothetical protein